MQAEKQNELMLLYTADMRTGRPAHSPRSEFGKRLYELREAAGLTQQEIADQLGISQPSYALWERRNVVLRTEQIANLGNILGCSVEQLILGTSVKKPRRSGPDGKARRMFEEVSQMPRAQQQHVLTVVEAFVKQYALTGTRS